MYNSPDCKALEVTFYTSFFFSGGMFYTALMLLAPKSCTVLQLKVFDVVFSCIIPICVTFCVCMLFQEM